MNMVGVAQLVRALGCGPGGHGFETHHSPHFASRLFEMSVFDDSAKKVYSSDLSSINNSPLNENETC
jgi:hypothetical protein